MLRKVDPSSTFCNKFLQLATLKFVAWQVEHAVVIRATTLFNLQCNNVARQVERKCCPYYLAFKDIFSNECEVHNCPLFRHLGRAAVNSKPKRESSPADIKKQFSSKDRKDSLPKTLQCYLQKSSPGGIMLMELVFQVGVHTGGHCRTRSSPLTVPPCLVLMLVFFSDRSCLVVAAFGVVFFFR